MTGRGRAVVVGGGVAGLTWALDALDAGFEVIVLEREHRLGGVVRSEQLGPVTVDVGAESFAVTRPELLQLTERLGLADIVERPATHQAHVLTHGRLLPLPPGLLGIPTDADDIAELLGADHAAEARRRDALPLPAQPPTTLGRLVRERLGDVVTDTLVDPVIAGVHATRADDAELASVAPSLYSAARTGGGLMEGVRMLRGTLGPAGAPVASLTGGMGRLVEQLTTTLSGRGAQLRTGVTATAVHRDTSWHVRTSEGRLRADVLCLAVPARAAAGLLAAQHSVDVGGPDGAAATRTVAANCGAVATLLRALPTTDDVLLVTLLLEDSGLTRAGSPVGSGVLVADDLPTGHHDAAPGTTPLRAKALTHASAKWGWLSQRLPADHHVIRLSFGGTYDVAATRATGRDSDADGEQHLIATALDELHRLLGDALRAPHVRASLVTRWQGVLSRPVVGRTATLDELDALLAAIPGLALVGSAVAGNGLAGVVGRSRREAARTL